MARRWTPQRLMILRRIRVTICVVSLVLASAAAFAFTARKTVALTVNGSTRTVSTYAMSVDRLLQQQRVDVKTHDLVTSTSGDALQDHAVVTVRSAYQTTITINGQEVPFWTIATSADQLLGFFKENDQQAAKVTVNIGNVYNQLTGGLVINAKGPVTVIADGKTSVAPDGRLPAASILDSKGITLGKDDRVNVEQDGGTTILRVRRVTHGQETRTKDIAFSTRTVTDASLQPGQSEVRQEGVTGQQREVYAVTYVDGQAESESLVSKTTTKAPLDRVVAVGPAKAATNDDGSPSNDTGDGKHQSGSGSSHNDADNGKASATPSAGPSASASSKPTSEPSSSPTASTPTDNQSSQGSGSASTPKPTPTPTPTPAPQPQPTGLWHPTPAQAQAYAAGAAAQYGWTGQQWRDLVTLWNHESSWSWSAQNPTSPAYGIPQANPGSNMSLFGANWRDDASVQIAWGLNYIKGRYGSPSAAWAYWQRIGCY